MTSAWAFAVAAWGRPGVEAICLELQNVHGQLPVLLLWRWWTLEEDRPVDPVNLAKAIEIARNWDDEMLRPLRALRQRLAAPFDALTTDTARASVRRRVLEAELEAEHALLDALEALQTHEAPKTAATKVASRLEEMAALAGGWRPPTPSAALIRLVEAL